MSSLPSKKVKIVCSAGKVMASVFCNFQDVILIKYFEKGHTVTKQHYSGQMKNLQKVITEKRPGMHTRGILFHQDNAPTHTSVFAVATIYDVDLNLFPIHLICQAWPPLTSIFFPKLKTLGLLPFCQ